MALLGISLIVASVIFLCLRPPTWLPKYFTFRQGRIEGARPVNKDGDQDNRKEGHVETSEKNDFNAPAKADLDRAAMPPPPPPPALRMAAPKPAIQADDSHEEEQTTPKATAASRSDPVPSFSLSAADPEPDHEVSQPMPMAPPPAPNTSPGMRQPAAPGLMGPPPPRLPTLTPTSSSPSSSSSSSLSPGGARNLPIPRRNLPLPNRGPGSSSSSLAPPPTHSTMPVSKQVTLTPGHSPLDWARLSGSPTSDLRGLPPSTPYLRVTPSMLRRQTGRKGTDAWMALGGKVYNISPYVPFHPGGKGELLRGAARDGTKLFGENHPWVNYETMLSACLVGILVDEDDKEGKMEEMD